MNFIFPLILGMLIIPIDELIFFRGVAKNHQPAMAWWFFHQLKHVEDLPVLMVFSSRSWWPGGTSFLELLCVPEMMIPRDVYWGGDPWKTWGCPERSCDFWKQWNLIIRKHDLSQCIHMECRNLCFVYLCLTRCFFRETDIDQLLLEVSKTIPIYLWMFMVVTTCIIQYESLRCMPFRMRSIHELVTHTHTNDASPSIVSPKVLNQVQGIKLPF